VRSRIVRTTVAVAAIALLLLAVPLAFAVSALYNNDAAQALLADAARTAAAVPAPPLEPGDPVELAAASSGATIAVYAPDGSRIAGVGPARADAVTLAALQGRPTTAKADGEISVALPVGAQERLVGAVRAALPQAAVDDRIRGTWLTMLGLGTAAIVVAALLALWQARRLSQPLDKLARVAARLGDGDFSAVAQPSNIREVDVVAGVMRRTSQRLAGVLERERAFSADASHQLKTPLTALRIQLEGALARPGGDHVAETRRALEEIERLQGSVDALLRLARDVPGDRRSVGVATVISGSTTAWRLRLRAARRQLEVTVPEGLSRITVSESALRQVLEVLVDNAIKHGAGTVTVHARELRGAVVIDVGDEGTGITDSDDIFERRRSGTGGEGIGLALARSLTLAEGGRLSLVGKGPHPVFRIAFVADQPE
jgi:signal transduction histidine kinase